MFEIKYKIAGQGGNNDKNNLKIMVPLKFEMPLINCEINLDINWSKNCAIEANNANQGTTFLINDTKH